MREIYMQLAGFAQTWGLVYFFVAFLCVCAYAYWPTKKHSFDEASQIPLKED